MLSESAQRAPVRVVLCWHMHQPCYRDLLSGQYALPWVYLHAIKDYLDMAMHLERHPQACAVINFTPVLLEQIEDYAAQVNGWLRQGVPLKDPVLRLLTPEGIPAAGPARTEAVHACLQAHRTRMIERFEPFRRLADQAGRLLQHGQAATASESFVADLATWFHLAWIGESLRRGDPRVRALMQRPAFSAADRRLLLEIIGETLAGIIPRYRRLMGAGQVELSVTPWGHPILPLLFDFNSAREAWPEAPLPPDEYPGGEDRASWHVARALQVFTRIFGVRPRGCWPAEAAISRQTLALLDRFSFDWVASSGEVLRNSLPSGTSPSNQGAYVLAPHRIRCFFRHDPLSDRIGFSYAAWDPHEAVKHFLGELEKLSGVITIALDGENAWEHYAANGWDFLDELYRRLAEHPGVQLSTFSQCLTQETDAGELQSLTAGSWVHGRLDTWIGNPARNRAWEMLCEAKQVFDQVVVEGALTEEQERAAEHQLGICEGSDWFWWLSNDHPPETTARFDALFRCHLKNLYRILGEQAPENLDRPLIP